MKSQKTRGFTLLEMSVVIVIIALIVGAVMAGQSLIRSSEMRSIYTSAQGYINAINAFNDKYGSLPGDFPTATSVWGAESSCPGITSNSRLTCNGDGNQHIDDLKTSGTWYESFRAWQHLALAGLSEGKYSGLGYGSASNWQMDAMPKVNIPGGVIPGSGYSAVYDDGSVLTILTGAPTSFNMLLFGASRDSTGAASGPTDQGIISAGQAWTIDRKIDDGLPGSGKITTINNSNCVTTSVAATALYNEAGAMDKACMLIFAIVR